MAFGINSFKIYNKCDNSIKKHEKSMRKYLNKCLKEENVKNAVFNIIIVPSEEIKQLNRNYRGIDDVTDVISFALEDEKEENKYLKKRYLGDIYICYSRAVEQAQTYEHSLTRELCFLSVHGLLHLLGYDHMKKEEEKIMFEKQDQILGKRSMWEV